MAKIENRYVSLFEDFMTEVTATAVSKTDIKVPKSIEDKSLILEAGLEEYQKGLAEFKKKYDPIIATNEKLTKEIEEDLRKVGVVKIKIHKMVYEMMHKAGRLTDSYKDLWELALTKLNAKTKADLLKIQAENKHVNPDKDWMDATFDPKNELSVDEAMTWHDLVKKGGALLSKAKEWISSAWAKISGSIKEFFDQADDLESVYLKIKKENPELELKENLEEASKEGEKEIVGVAGSLSLKLEPAGSYLYLKQDLGGHIAQVAIHKSQVPALIEELNKLK